MIGNAISWGSTGFTILEEGELDRGTRQLRVARYLVCRPDGQLLPGSWSLEEARREVERLEETESRPPP